MSRAGRWVVTRFAEEEVRAFVPPPLPPDPPLAIGRFLRKLDRANQALGRLDGLTTVLPDPHLLIYFYVRKEAVLSSQIEGTQSTLSDLLLYELESAPGVPLDDVAEVSSYVSAMTHGLQRLRDGFPLSLRLIREIHEILLRAGRGAEKVPGEFRRSQNWIQGSRPGNAAFVPPPPDEVVSLMGQLEHFLHDESPELPVLVKAALAHVQFETIHPFLDGNGRVGRLLITFLLCVEGVLKEPLLYLSLHLKRHRALYYELLQRVRQDGDWEAWLDFFLDSVIETATQAADTANSILALFADDRSQLHKLGKAAGSALRIQEHFQRHPLASISHISERLELTFPAVSKSVERLVNLSILTEVTGRRRERIFAYSRYLDLLGSGTEPLPRA